MTLLDFIQPHLTDSETDIQDVLSRISITLTTSTETVRGYGSNTEEMVSALVEISYDGVVVETLEDAQFIR